MGNKAKRSASKVPAKKNGIAPALREFEVLTSVKRYGKTLKKGARFALNRGSPRVHTARWLKQGRIREV